MDINQTVAAKLQTPHRLLHTMLRVRGLDQSITFYSVMMGMRVLRKQDYSEDKFTLVFLGYGTEDSNSVLELTYNWDETDYTLGSGFGHIALAVDDINSTYQHLMQHGAAVIREPGPMKSDSGEIIAFVKDPDGYSIELIERR